MVESARDIRQTYNGVTVRTQGLRSASRALSKAGDYAEDQKELMHEIGLIVSNEAKRIAPVRTGTLRESIRAGKGKTKAVVRAGFKRVPYAPVVHYGWPDRNIPAQPYLYEALAKTRTQVIARYDRGMEALLYKAGLDPSSAGRVPQSSQSFTISP
jgi:hypothetical protein